MGVLAWFEPLGELHEELDAALHIFEIHDLAWSVHIAQRNADQAGGDTASAHLNCAGVSARRPRVSFNLVGDF